MGELGYVAANKWKKSQRYSLWKVSSKLSVCTLNTSAAGEYGPETSGTYVQNEEVIPRTAANVSRQWSVLRFGFFHLTQKCISWSFGSSGIKSTPVFFPTPRPFPNSTYEGRIWTGFTQGRIEPAHVGGQIRRGKFRYTERSGCEILPKQC